MREKLKRFNLGCITIFMGLLPLLAACKKKDRLSASTYAFSISPPATTLVKNNSITLTAKGLSAAGAIDVNPTWAVSSEAGVLNTSIGPTVVLTAAALGDITVTATFDGRSARSHIAIVTYMPTANTFDVYNDAGLPPGPAVDSDIFTSAGLSIAESSVGYAPEGVRYEEATFQASGNFWGVTLDKNGAGKSQNLQAFTNGTLKFSIRLKRVLDIAEQLAIDVRDSSNALKSISTSGWGGFDRTDAVDWQEISIPASSYFPTLSSAIRVPFTIRAVTLGGALEFDIDAVRWEK